VAGIDYRWERRLGGRRKVQTGSPPVALLLADAAVLTRDAGGTVVYDVGGDVPLPM